MMTSTQHKKKGGKMSNWPVDENGVPLAQVSMGASEKIGLPNYSNIDVGPALVTRFVKDDTDSIKEGLRFCAQVCEDIIAEERDAIMSALKS